MSRNLYNLLLAALLFAKVLTPSNCRELLLHPLNVTEKTKTPSLQVIKEAKDTLFPYEDCKKTRYSSSFYCFGEPAGCIQNESCTSLTVYEVFGDLSGKPNLFVKIASTHGSATKTQTTVAAIVKPDDFTTKIKQGFGIECKFNLEYSVVRASFIKFSFDGLEYTTVEARDVTDDKFFTLDQQRQRLSPTTTDEYYCYVQMGTKFNTTVNEKDRVSLLDTTYRIGIIDGTAPDQSAEHIQATANFGNDEVIFKSCSTGSTISLQSVITLILPSLALLLRTKFF